MIAAGVGVVSSVAVLADGVVSLGGLVALLVAIGAVRLAAQLATRLTRPWLRDAISVANLRTE